MRSRSTSLLLLFLATLLAGVFYVHEIELRPLHSDEAVNHFFVEKILRTGFYRYSHKNYHGPLYFYSLLPARYLFGDTISALRLPSILCTLLIFPALLFFRGFCRNSFFVYAAVLIISSPSLVFFSRYAIHEPLFVLCSLLFAASCFSWSQRLNAKSLFAASIATALLICTKETFVVAGFSVLLALLSCCWDRLPSIFNFLRTSLKHLWFATLLACLLIAFVYTAGFYWLEGLHELVFGIPQWIARGSGDVGHHKDTLYYLRDILLRAEPGLLAAIIISAVVLTVNWKKFPRHDANFSDQRLSIFLFVWMLSTTTIYSLIPYKTAWLVINISLPSILFVAHSLSRIEVLGPRYTRFTKILVALLFLCSMYFNLTFNYRTMPLLGGTLGNKLEFQEQNPFRYVHTLDVFFRLEGKIRREMESRPDAQLLIAMSGYWPLPFYIRDLKKRIRYVTTEDPGAYELTYDLILTKSDSPWRPEGWRRYVYRITRYKRVALYVRETHDHEETG